MIVIHRTKNGWILRNETSFISLHEIETIHSFHSNSGLVAYLHKHFGITPERDAKGHFRSTKKDKA